MNSKNTKTKFLVYTFFFILILSLHSKEKQKNNDSINLGHIFTIVEKSPVPETIITSEEIHNSPSSSIQQLLTQKGLLVMSSGGSGTPSNVSLKGYAGFCIKVYIDGILANQSGTGEFDWNSIDINSVESITIKQIPSFTSDQFAGSAVYITTKLFSSKGFNVKTLLTGYENSPLDILSIHGEYRDFIGTTGLKINVQATKASNNYETKYGTLENNGSSLVNLNGSFNTSLSENLTLTGQSKFFTNEVKAFNTGASRQQGLENDYNSLQNLKLKYVTEQKQIFTAAVSNQYTQINYKAGKNTTEKTKLSSTDFFTIAENIKNFNFFILCSLENKINGTPEYRFHATPKIQYEKKFSSWFEIDATVGGLFSSNKDTGFLPQLSISSKKTGLSVNAFHEYILPTFNQLYYEGSGGTGNPELNSEDGWSVVFNFTSPFMYLPVSATYTHSYYKNKIRWQGHKDGLLCAINTENGTYDTWEIKSSYNWKHFGYEAGITNTGAKLKTGKQIMWVPQWQWNGAININPCEWLHLNTNFIYTGKRPEDNKNLFWYDPVKNLSAGAKIDFTKNASLIFEGNNLLDEKLFYHDNYPIPSRSFTVGYTLKY